VKHTPIYRDTTSQNLSGPVRATQNSAENDVEETILARYIQSKIVVNIHNFRVIGHVPRVLAMLKASSGVAHIEYVLIAALITVVMSTGLWAAGASVIDTFSTVVQTLCPHDINLDRCIRSAQNLAPMN
jgi:Flp pilus assembly pilin Flp